MPNPYNDPADVYRKPGAGFWLGNIGGGAASGAATGSAFGPYGTLIGGIVGAGVGVAQGAAQAKSLHDAWLQQQQLQAELNSQAISQGVMTDAALRGSYDQHNMMIHAAQQAAAAGLSPIAAAGMQSEAELRGAMNREQLLAAAFGPAQEAQLAHQRQVLQNYQVAQALASNAAGSAPDYSSSMGELAKAITTAQGTKPPADSAATTAETKTSTPDPGIPSLTEQGTYSPEQQRAEDWARSVEDPWGYKSAFGPSNKTTLTPEESWNVQSMDPWAPPPVPGVGAGAVSGQDAVSSRSSGGSGGSGGEAGAKGGSGGTRPTGAVPGQERGGALPPPGQATSILDETHQAVKYQDIDALLARTDSSHAAQDYLAWKHQMMAAGYSASDISPARWASFVKNSPSTTTGAE